MRWHDNTRYSVRSEQPLSNEAVMREGLQRHHFNVKLKKLVAELLGNEYHALSVMKIM